VAWLIAKLTNQNLGTEKPFLTHTGLLIEGGCHPAKPWFTADAGISQRMSNSQAIKSHRRLILE
jgi:hypothetical protein